MCLSCIVSYGISMNYYFKFISFYMYTDWITFDKV